MAPSGRYRRRKVGVHAMLSPKRPQGFVISNTTATCMLQRDVMVRHVAETGRKLDLETPKGTRTHCNLVAATEGERSIDIPVCRQVVSNCRMQQGNPESTGLNRKYIADVVQPRADRYFQRHITGVNSLVE